MQFSDLLAQPVPGIEKRCPDLDKIPHARVKGSNPLCEFDHANGSDLEPEIAQEPSDVILDSDGLLLQKKQLQMKIGLVPGRSPMLILAEALDRPN